MANHLVQTMKVIFYGHACLKMCDARGRGVLMDPWFSPHGAFFRSWFQFPENTPWLDEALEGVDDICVSHNHADHFDPHVLLHAFDNNPRLTLHLPHYRTDWFAKLAADRLTGYTDRIVMHPGYEPFAIGESMSVFFTPEDSPGAIDAAIIGTDGEESLVNLNDSRLSSDQLLRIREMVGAVTYLTLQASGASEYPISYRYPAEEIERRSLVKRRDKLAHCTKIIDLMDPQRVLFFAGPPVFLDESLARLNTRHPKSIFPDQLDIVQEFAETRPDISRRALFLVPGEEFDDRYLWHSTSLDDQRLKPYTRKDEYIRAYRERREGVVRFHWGRLPEDKALVRHLYQMTRLSPYISDLIGGSITFIVRDAAGAEQAYTVNFPERRVRHGQIDDPLYVLTAPASAVQGVLDRTHTWDDVFLSFRMTFDERTEHFVPHLKALLRYMDAGLFAELEAYERRLRGDLAAPVPMYNVEHDGETFRIQRLCPHAGTDLEHHGRINPDGTITCLAHRFCFDLRTGACTNAAAYRLKTEPRSRVDPPGGLAIGHELASSPVPVNGLEPLAPDHSLQEQRGS